MADSGETSLIDLAKSMNELNALFEGVTSWSRLTGACCAVVLDQEEKTPEEEDFHKKKIEVVRFLQLFVLFYFQNSKKLFYRNFLSNVSHCTHWITPKDVTSLRGSTLRRCARAILLLLNKCRSGGEPLATLCPI